MAISLDEFRCGMRQLAAAVNVIAAGASPQRNGLTATAVVSLTAEPPQVGISVNRTASAFELIRSNGHFAVNVLAKEQIEVAASFAGAAGLKGEDKFAVGSWGTLATGAPVLAGAAASFDCRIVQEIDLGTHVFFVGLVEAVEVAAASQPLLYMDGSWANLVRPSSLDLDRYREAMRQSMSSIDDAVRIGGTPTEQLREFAERFALVNMSQTEITRQFFWHELYAPAAELHEINALKREFDHKLRELLAQGARSGDFAVEDAQVTAMAIAGMMSWVHRWYRDRGRLQSEEIAKRFASLVLSMVSGGAHSSQEQSPAGPACGSVNHGERLAQPARATVGSSDHDARR